jgi:hypothetical protein
MAWWLVPEKVSTDIIDDSTVTEQDRKSKNPNQNFELAEQYRLAQEQAAREAAILAQQAQEAQDAAQREAIALANAYAAEQERREQEAREQAARDSGVDVKGRTETVRADRDAQNNPGSIIDNAITYITDIVPDGDGNGSGGDGGRDRDSSWNPGDGEDFLKGFDTFLGGTTEFLGGTGALIGSLGQFSGNLARSSSNILGAMNTDVIVVAALATGVLYMVNTVL